MGSWFSNIHIKKNENAFTEAIVDFLKKTMMEKKYHLVQDREEADAVVTLVAQENCPWISVYSQVFAHDDPESCLAIAKPISAALRTDVLGISCFDSDYLYLNLVNDAEELDAWIGIGNGKEIGIKRRSALTPWKKKIRDYPVFSAGAKETYIIADQFLQKAAPCLELSMERCVASEDDLDELGLEQDAICFFFKSNEEVNEGGVQLRLYGLENDWPCYVDRKSCVTFLNAGEEGKGLSLYFLGAYVERDELTFSDVYIRVGVMSQWIPVTLSKVQLLDGKWAYCCRNLDILIPPGVPKRLNPNKRNELVRDRWIMVSFIPHGNPKYTLDVTLFLVPEENQKGQCGWRVWHRFGSKKAFIEWHNKSWKFVASFEGTDKDCLPLLKLKDFE